MAIIYNGADLSTLTYNGTRVTEVYVCDTSTTCCIRVFPKTITYDYCAFDYSVNLDFTCNMHCYCTSSVNKCLTNGTSNSYNKICWSVVTSSTVGTTGGICCGRWYTTDTCCVDASPTCTYCESGTSCIQVYTLSTWQTNSLNVANNNCYYVNADESTLAYFCCNFVYSVNTTGNSIEYPAVTCVITNSRESESPWICWCSNVTVDCPQNSRFVVMACIVNGTSTVLACCPISNSSGSITIDLP